MGVSPVKPDRFLTGAARIKLFMLAIRVGQTLTTRLQDKKCETRNESLTRTLVRYMFGIVGMRSRHATA